MCICVCMCTYTHNGILFSYKTEGNPDICDNLEGITLREKRDNHYMYIFYLYVESKSIILIETKLNGSCHGLRGKGGQGWEMLVKRHKLSFLR